MSTKISKQKIYQSVFIILGASISFLFTKNNFFWELDSLLINFFLFILFACFSAWIFYLTKHKEPYHLNYLIILVLILLFSGSVIFGYKLGWAETMFFPLITFSLLVPFSIFSIKKPEKIIKNISFLFLFIIIIISFLNFNKFFFGGYCHYVRKGKNLGGECYFADKESASKNLLGTVIIHPEIPGVRITLSSRKKTEILGKSKDLYILNKGNISNTIEAYPDKIHPLENSNKFTMPFSTISKNGEHKYYLGIFEASAPYMSTSDLGFYKFYKSFTHLDSFSLGENVKIGQTMNDKIGLQNGIYHGAYAYPLIQEIFKDNELIKIRLRVEDGPYKFFYERKDCNEVGEIVKKVRGDGEKYYVCILEENRQCELGLYNRLNCPMDGFDISKAKNEAEVYSITMGKILSKTKGGFLDHEKDRICSAEEYYMGNCD